MTSSALAPIVTIEGTDGSGKRTQTAAVREGLTKLGLRVNWFTFPQYEVSFLSKIIIKFLNGDLGNPKDYHPIVRSLMFSLERFEKKSEIFQLRTNADVLILDRYIASNLAYQISQLPSNQWAECIEYILEIETNILGLPIPDLNIFLDVDPNVAQINVSGKPHRKFLKETYDENERDLNLLKSSHAAYKYLVRESILAPWISIKCHNIDSELLSENEITQKIIFRSPFDNSKDNF